jgi:hypothetical protein
MTDPHPDSARVRAEAVRQARAARARTLRRRIIGGSVALFVATWLLITIVLVSGHDPALAKNSAATVASSSSPTTSTSSGSTASTSSGSTGSSASTSSQSGSAVSSVTTRQS